MTERSHTMNKLLLSVLVGAVVIQLVTDTYGFWAGFFVGGFAVLAVQIIFERLTQRKQ